MIGEHKMKKIIDLGEVLVNILIRAKVSGDKKEDIIDVISMLKNLGMDEFEAREAQRGFEKISDNIAVSCKKILDKTNLQEEQVERIVENIIVAYTNLNLDMEKFLNFLSVEGDLKKELLRSNPRSAYYLDGREMEIYERMLEHTSHIVKNAYIKLPEFSPMGIKRLNFKMEEIVDKVDDLLEQMEKVNQIVLDKDEKIGNFERNYRNQIISKNSYINLFGAAGLEREYKRYPLSIAYVELELVEELCGKEIILENIFGKSRNIWILGEAGSGKTTFLQWIAVNSAENNKEIKGLRNTIPILIELRKYDSNKISLKECIANVMKDVASGIPEGWIEQSIDSGRFVFLIDGFDEIRECDRAKILNWIEELDTHHKCIKVFTARPQVKERPVTDKLLEMKILPMGRERIRKFIEYWHRAVLEEQLRVDKDNAEKIANSLTEKIMQSEALFRLASNPLLCAMICALHYGNDMNLPTNKRELYEECCKMLIEKRDIERGIDLENINLNYEQKKVILAQLAYWMMKNNYVEVAKKEAVKSVKRSISGMSVLESANVEGKIFKHLLERCGVLREIERGKIDFIHRTFQEYLTAYEISRQEDWGYIKEKIGNTIWQETIVMCIGYANREIANEIIDCTLKKAKVSTIDRKYLFIAISYLNGAVEVDRNLRTQIEEEVSKLIPPSLSECQSFADVGNLAVQYLKCEERYNHEERLACLRVLRIIGTNNALEMSKSYFQQVLEEDELKEIGMLYCQFTKAELIENEIPAFIKEYVKKYCDKSVVIHYEMMKVMNYLKSQDINELSEKHIISLKIIDYYDDTDCEWKKIFKDVEKLSLYGDFTCANILKVFSELKSLTICSLDNDFSIYDLGLYKNLYNIIEFTIISSSSEYITGRDLKFLKNCVDIGFILLNDGAELILEDFIYLPCLQKLTIGAEFALDFDYDALSDNVTELVLLIPYDQFIYAEASVDSLRFRGTSVHLEDFDVLKDELDRGYNIFTEDFIEQEEY